VHKRAVAISFGYISFISVRLIICIFSIIPPNFPVDAESRKSIRGFRPPSLLSPVRMETVRTSITKSDKHIGHSQVTLSRTTVSVMRLKKGEEGCEGVFRERERRRAREREDGGKRCRCRRPCGIRPPLRAHDSRKSLRLGIAPPGPAESTCRPPLRVGAREIDEERALKEIIDCGHY